VVAAGEIGRAILYKGLHRNAMIPPTGPASSSSQARPFTILIRFAGSWGRRLQRCMCEGCERTRRSATRHGICCFCRWC
jgi:hypothetical protein